MSYKSFRFKAVLFDFDGTLTIPGLLDFATLKKNIGCPAETAVLEFLDSVKDPLMHRQASQELELFEALGAKLSKANSGAETIIAYIRSQGLHIGILTRNSQSSVNLALKNFDRVGPADFDVIISREDPIRPKPSADGVILAAHKLNIKSEEILVVGDYIFDIQAGKQAGAITVLLENQDNSHTEGFDFRIKQLQDLKSIITMGLPLNAGKLANNILQSFLEEFQFEDASVIVQPGVGEDTAAVDIRHEEVIVLKSDPITFATEAIGKYAVLVNANDIVCSGALPRWFLTTLLLPVGFTPSRVRQLMNELYTVCRRWQITLCGGHTEISDAVTRPVVIGMMAGTVSKSKLIDKRNVKSGDQIFITKTAGIEGTAIIAREFKQRLKLFGLLEGEIEAYKIFLDRISILTEAKLAVQESKVTAMHDVTEGGVATAIEELSMAANHRFCIHLDKIPVDDQTKKICGLFDINPYGLIGSGSLIICCRPENSVQLTSAIQEAGVPISCIGEVLGEGQGIDALSNNQPTSWPRFEVDEITRLFDNQN